MIGLLLFVLVLGAPAVAGAACTGSSPALSAPDTGNTATNGTNLAACITAAVLGDTISLTAGAEYTGNFTLGNKGAGSSPITIRPVSLATLPAGVRVSPSSAANMPKLTTATGSPVVALTADSHHWTLVGLHFTTTTAPLLAGQRVPNLISDVNDGSVTFNHWPHDITIDRCLLHPLETDPVPYRAAEAGVQIDGATISVTNSYLYDFTGWESPSAVGTITTATNASPVQVTLSASMADPGQKVLIYLQGATSGWTGLNGLKLATWVDGTHLTLENYNVSTFALTNVDSTSWGSFSGQTVSQMSRSIATSRGILIVTGPGPYTIQNNYIEAYYTPLFTGGGGTWLDPQNDVTVSSVSAIDTVVLSSVGQLQVGDLIAFDTMATQSISTATAGNPTVLTVTTHRFPAGTILYPEGGSAADRSGGVTVSGFTGAWAAINGEHLGTVVDSTHISIPVDSTAFGAVTGSAMTWLPVVKGANNQWHVGKVTNIAGTTVTYSWWGHQPDNTNGNGAGLLVASGSRATFRGTMISNVLVTGNTLGTKRYWIRLYRDAAATCQNCTDQGPKGVWEAKQGNTITIRGNIIRVFGSEGLSDLPHGVSIALSQANQNGSTPWVTLNTWLIENNLFDGYVYMKIHLQEEYETGALSTNCIIRNNLFRAAQGSTVSFEGGDSLQVLHNTFRNMAGGGGAYGGYTAWVVAFGPNTNALLRDNIGALEFYGVDQIDPMTSPTIDHNFLIDRDSQNPDVPAGITKVTNDAAMGFVDSVGADAGGDYHGYALTVGSTYHHAASDGTDPGVNFAALDAALGGLTPVQVQGKTTLGGKAVFQ